MKESLFIRWLPVVIWALFIFITSANPNPYRSLPASWAIQSVPVQVEPGSKGITSTELLGRYLHAAEYLILAALIAWALDGGGLRIELLAMAFGLTMLYALSDEVHQLFVPGRAFELSDLALDLSGATIGLIAYVLIITLWKRRVR